jgi:hypothetical protein
MVIHGPEVFDHGDAAWLLERLSFGRAIVAGVMARTAAEESGLPVEFDGRPPSRVIREIEGPVCWDDWVQEIVDRYAGRLTVVLDLREPSP